MNILITNTRAPGGLELARLLHQAGHRVFSFESFRFHLGLNSKSIIKNYHCSSPRFKPNEYVNQINNVIERENIEMIIPCFEESFYISKFQKKINCSNIYVENIDLLRKVHHKYDFIKLSIELGLNVPESHLIESQEDFDQLGLKSNDYVFKPCFSRYGEEVIISPAIYRFIEGSWVCQKRIFGRSYCTYSTCKAGKVLSLAIYPVEIVFGKVCTSFCSIDQEHSDYKKIKEWVKTFVDKTSFTGQVGFDFIVDQEALAIECNPRMTSGIHLFNDNSNFTQSLFEPMEIVEPQKGVQMNMTLLFGFTPKFYLTAIDKTIKGRDVIFKLNDIWPFINQFSLFFYILILSIRKKLSLSKITSYDIEWNGE